MDIFKKTYKVFASIALAMVLYFGTTPVALSGDVLATATANLIDDIRAFQNKVLDFGHFTVGATGGTVTVNAAGTSATGAITHIQDGARGQFELTGDPNRFFIFAVNTPNITIQNGAGDTMAVTITNTFAINRFNGAGKFFHNVGGELTVNANQAKGSYSGNYTAVAYFF
jgi:hypothetical protein